MAIELNSLWIRKNGFKHHVCEVVSVDEYDVFYKNRSLGNAIFYCAADTFERDFYPLSIDETMAICPII